MNRANRKQSYIKGAAGLILAGFLVTCSGCQLPEVPFLHLGSEDIIFKVGDTECTEPEAKVILMSYQKEYSNLYGINMWVQGSETGLDQYIKELSLSQLAQIYTLSEIGDLEQVTLSEEEHGNAQKAAKEYINGLTSEERGYIDASTADVTGLFEHYVKAQKLYESMTENSNKEVSDDEARVMEVQRIVVPEKQTADEIMAQVQAGNDFSSLAATYSELGSGVEAIDRTVYTDDISDILFDLSEQEYTQVLQTEQGYTIFYCVSPYNPGLTEANKPNILKKRLDQIMGDVYADYDSRTTSTLSKTAWDAVVVDTELETQSPTFFEVYHTYFGE